MDETSFFKLKEKLVKMRSRITRQGEIIIREQLPYVHPDKRDHPPHHSRKQYKEIWEKDEGVCGGCGKSADPDYWNADHIKSHASGGRTTVENGQVMHPKCNNRKSGASDRKFSDSDHLIEQISETVIETLVSLLIQNLVYPWIKKMKKKFLN